jgi:hypothetical protein
MGQRHSCCREGASIQDHDGRDWIGKNGADAVENRLMQEDDSTEFIFKNNGIA